MRPLNMLLQAPFTLHAGMLAQLAQVADAAAAGRTARIVVKINALTDAALIEALVYAARAGAQIDLIVRGACLLSPEAAGLADRIRVRSIVGRFLEHSRVAYFRWGDGDEDEAVFLSSADWMGRNMFGRVEVCWPVHDPALRQRVIDECLVPYLLDGCDAWLLRSDGSYEPVERIGASAQQSLMRRYSGS
jgi:polyphosphate kinase